MAESSSPRLKRQPLGEVGLAHIRSRLGASRYTSSLPLRRELQRLRLEQGEAWTWRFTSVAVTEADLAGGLPPGATQEMTREAITDFIADYLRVPGRLAVIEDHEAQISDPWLQTDPPTSPWLAYNSHLYWYAKNQDRLVVQDFLGAGVSLFTCIALAPLAQRWPSDRPLTEDDLLDLARAADHFAVDAFDFEGWVVWSRGQT